VDDCLGKRTGGVVVGAELTGVEVVTGMAEVEVPVREWSVAYRDVFGKKNGLSRGPCVDQVITTTFPAVVTKCSAQCAVFSGEKLRVGPKLKEFYFRANSRMAMLTRNAFLQKRGLQTAKPWTRMQMKQELFGSDDSSSSDRMRNTMDEFCRGSRVYLRVDVLSSFRDQRCQDENCKSERRKIWDELRENDDLKFLSRM